MQRRTSLFLISSVLGAVVMPEPVSAHPRPRRPAYSVTLIDTRGRPLPTFWHRGQRWAMGEYGAQYALRLTNHTSRRVEAVISVDGRDAISGEIGNYVKNRGYVLSPYSSLVVHGFRRSLSSVAAFRFTDPNNSYSARMGTPQNVGVIGVAFFGERATHPRPPRPRVRHHHRRSQRESTEHESHRSERDESAPAPRGRSHSHPRHRPPHRPDTGNLGTEYGHREHSHARYVRFRRAHPSRPDQIQTLRYDDARGLEARGIPVHPPPPEPRPYPDTPHPFPENGFAPPPP